MTEYVVVYRDGKVSQPASWDRVKFLVRQALALPPPFWPAGVLRIDGDRPG